ncbi:MAG: XTP/dITP diphosphatase [Pseudomonadota bacterium]
MEIVLATRNQGKVAELKAMLASKGINVTSLAQHPEISDIEEDGKTFLENARKKAHTVAKSTGCITLADDSGLVVEALGGAPGVNSARFAGKQGDYAANNEKLLKEMKDVPDGKRQAAFVCTMVLAHPKGTEWHVDGRCDGIITREYRGDGGFGFDPLFYVPEEGATMAELPMEKKNAISHRGKALKKIYEILIDLLRKTEKL